MFNQTQVDSRTRSGLLFNSPTVFSAENNLSFGVDDKSTISKYDPAAFAIFSTTDLTVDGSKVKGGYDKGFSISPATGYKVSIKLSGTTGDLEDIPSTVVLEGGDRLDRNGIDGKYTLTLADGTVTTGGSRTFGEDHFFEITKVEEPEVEDDDDDDDDDGSEVIVQTVQSGPAISPVMIGVGAIGLIAVVALMK